VAESLRIFDLSFIVGGGWYGSVCSLLGDISSL
jgi:hypothetical protein